MLRVLAETFALHCRSIRKETLQEVCGLMALNSRCTGNAPRIVLPFVGTTLSGKSPTERFTMEKNE